MAAKGRASAQVNRDGIVALALVPTRDQLKERIRADLAALGLVEEALGAGPVAGAAMRWQSGEGLSLGDRLCPVRRADGSGGAHC